MNVIPKSVSDIIKNKSQDDDEPKKRSREEWRKAKELDEARKAGTAPAAVDEEGRSVFVKPYMQNQKFYFLIIQRH